MVALIALRRHPVLLDRGQRRDQHALERDDEGEQSVWIRSKRSGSAARAFHAAHPVNSTTWQSTNQRLTANPLIASLMRSDQCAAASALRSSSTIVRMLSAAGLWGVADPPCTAKLQVRRRRAPLRSKGNIPVDAVSSPRPSFSPPSIACSAVLERAVFGIDVTGPIETPKFLEDERIVDFACPWLEPSGVVADLNHLDQLVLRGRCAS